MEPAAGSNWDGDNHAGVLAGIKSKEVAGSGYNQWVMDDTPNQLRQTFATATSQLNAVI